MLVIDTPIQRPLNLVVKCAATRVAIPPMPIQTAMAFTP